MIKKIINSNIGINALKKFFTIFSGIIFLVLMTRYLGAELRGEYAFIMNYVNILTTVFNLGISLVMPNFIKNSKDFEVSDFVSFSIYQFLFNLALSIILFLILQDTTYIIILILSSIAIFSMQLNNISLITSIRVNSIGFIISSTINATLIIFAFFLLDTKLIYVLIIYLIKEFVLIIYNLLNINYTLLRVRKKWSVIARSGLLPMLVTSMIALNYRIDILLLETFKVDFFSLGLFATGVALSEYSWLIPDIFKEVMLNKNAKRDEIHLTNVSIRFAFTSVLFFAFAFLLIGKYILILLFGNEFSEAYQVSVWMFFAVPFMVFVKIIGTLFITNGKWLLYFYILLITVSMNVLLNVLLIPKYNIFGSVIASICSYMFCGMYCLYWYSKNYRVKFFDLFLINKADIMLFRKYFTN